MGLVSRTIKSIWGGVSQMVNKPENKSKSQQNTTSNITKGVLKRQPSQFISSLYPYNDTLKKDKYVEFKDRIGKLYNLRMNSENGVNISDKNGNTYPIVYDNQDTIDYIKNENPFLNIEVSEMSVFKDKEMMFVTNKTVKTESIKNSETSVGEIYKTNEPNYYIFTVGSLVAPTLTDSGKTVDKMNGYDFNLTLGNTTFNQSEKKEYNVSITFTSSFFPFVSEINKSGLYKAEKLSSNTFKVVRIDGKPISNINIDMRVRTTRVGFTGTEWNNYSSKLNYSSGGGENIVQVGGVKEGFIVVENGLPEINYSVSLQHGSNLYTYSYTSTTTASTYSTTTIATDFLNAINTATGTTGFIAESIGSSLRIKRTDGDDFKVFSKDSAGDTLIKSFKESVNNFNDLPGKFFNYSNIEVKDIENNVSYYLIHKEGVWEEYKKLDLEDDLNGKKMIRKIELLFDTDNITETNQEGIYFKVSEIDWNSRLVGDEITAPLPSFLGSVINNIFTHQNRLGILSNNNVIFSKINEPFDFFPTSQKQVLDDDPIDLTVKNTGILKNVVTYNSNLLLTSDNEQHILTSNGKPFTPTSLVLQPTTSYNIDNNVKPISVGPYVYMIQNKLSYSGLLEYYLMENSISNSANDLTLEVPEYISKNSKVITHSSDFNMIFVLGEDSKTIYMNNYYYSGNKKLQNAWQTWYFEDPIININVDRGVLYLYQNNKNSNLVINKIDLEYKNFYNKDNKNNFDQTEFILSEGSLDLGETLFDLSKSYVDLSNDYQIFYNDTNISSSFNRYENNYLILDGDYSVGNIVIKYLLDEDSDLTFDIYLDKRVEVTGIEDSLNTTITIPYDIIETDNFSIIKKSNGMEITDKVDFVLSSGNNLVIKGIGHGELIFGYNYEMIYQLSELGERDQQGTIIEAINLKLRNIKIGYYQSGYFDLYINPVGSRERKQTFTGKVTGLSVIGKIDVSEGNFKMGVMSKNDKVEITVKNFTYLPSNINSLSWEAYKTQRSRGV